MYFVRMCTLMTAFSTPIQWIRFVFMARVFYLGATSLSSKIELWTVNRIPCGSWPICNDNPTCGSACHPDCRWPKCRSNHYCKKSSCRQPIHHYSVCCCLQIQRIIYGLFHLFCNSEWWYHVLLSLSTTLSRYCYGNRVLTNSHEDLIVTERMPVKEYENKRA